MSWQNYTVKYTLSRIVMIVISILYSFSSIPLLQYTKTQKNAQTQRAVIKYCSKYECVVHLFTHPMISQEVASVFPYLNSGEKQPNL